MQGANEIGIRNVIVPEAFMPPAWVEENLNKFKEEFKKEYNRKGKINQSDTKDLLKKYIFGPKVSPIWPLNKKNIGTTLSKLYDAVDSEEFKWRYYMIYNIGFFLSTFVSSSFTPESLDLPAQFKKRKKQIIEEFQKKIQEAKTEEEHDKAIIWVDKQFKKLTTDVLNYFIENSEKYPIVDSILSGAKGSPNDLRKLLIAVGLSINAKGEINKIIDKSHSEGITPTDFFSYTSQAVVSLGQKSIGTAKPGYLVRQLDTLMADVRLSRQIDCGTKRYLKIKVVNKNFLKSLKGKYYFDGSLKRINGDEDELIGEIIKLRSPLYCKAEDGICHTCYNKWFVERMALDEHSGIGLLAANANASSLTAATLKMAHQGLSLDKEEVNLEKDIFEFAE